MTHAILAPSAAERWTRCPGSVALAEQYGEPDTGSPYAAEGTAAHELAAQALQEGNEPQDYIGEVFEGYEATPEMAEYVARYTDQVRSIAYADAWVEEWIDVEDVPGVSGTPDFVGVDDIAEEVHVHDLKYGRGVRVDAAENRQLMLYALGAVRRAQALGYTITDARLFIHQPRRSHRDEWVVSVADLEAFAEQARTAARTALAIKDGTELFSREALVASEPACRWCPAKAHCPELADETAQTVYGELFSMSNLSEAKTPRPVDGLDTEQLAEVLARVDQIEGWCKAIRDRAAAELQAGREVPGYKLVEGKRGARQWSDPQEAERMLRGTFRLRKDEAYSFKLISPTQAGKLLSPQRYRKLHDLISQPPGKPALAPESDKRPSISQSADASEFE